MALTLNFEGPNDGRFDCNDKIIKCFACGGKPPYNWTTTAGTLDKTTGIVVKLSAPININPGSTPGSAAYELGAKYCSSLGFNDCVCQTFKCDGSPFGGCSGIGCASVVPCSCFGGSDNCTLWANCCTGEGEPCEGFAEFSNACAGLLAIHYVRDLRTQDMKDDGCGPCFVVMNGAVVTVTDSLGNSVSRSIKT